MKMQENKLKRFGVYGKVANVLFILTIVAGALFTLAGLTMSIYLNVAEFDLSEAANFIFESELPGASLMLPEGFEITYGMAFVVVANMALIFAVVAYVLKAVSNMFRHTVKERTPFTQNTVRCVKSIGAAILVYAAVVFVLSIVNSLLSPAIGVNMSIEWGMILIGFLVMALGEMFEFGMSLQQDSESIL